MTKAGLLISESLGKCYFFLFANPSVGTLNNVYYCRFFLRKGRRL